jgi:hypothetical protein
VGRGSIIVTITARAAVSIKCNHINPIEFILLIYASNSNSGWQKRSMVVAVPPGRLPPGAMEVRPMPCW